MKSIGGYTLEQELARGGAGVVYRARDPANGEAVAVKVLLAGRGADDAARRRFTREARALRRLDHPHVIRVRDAGEDDHRPYLVLDFVEGVSLQEQLDTRGPLDPRDAAQLIRKLAGALHHAHEEGVIHRDVKPGNVMLDRKREPRLTDFGLTRDMNPSASQSRLSQTGIFLGTPGFWAPEQANGDLDQVGAHSDVYALGATLYALLTGRPPHEATNLPEALRLVGTAPTPPSRFRPVPRELEAICLRCLEVEPRDRYATAAALRDAVAGFLQQRPRAESPTRRGPLGVALALIGAGLVTAVTLVSQTPSQPAPAPTQTPSTRLEFVADPDLDLAAELEEAWWRVHSLDGWEESEARYQTILLRSPDDPRALAALGALKFEQMETRRGTELLAGAQRRAPQDPWVLLAAGHVAGKTGQLNPGIVYTKLALEQLPDLAVGLAQLSSLRLNADDLEGAFEDAQRAVTLAPDQALVWVQRSLAQDEADAAVRDLERALELEPEHRLANASLAYMIRTDDSRAEEALEHWGRALDGPASTVHAYLPHRAEVLQRLGRLTSAVADFEAAIKHREKASLWLSLGILSMEGGWETRAGEAFDRALVLLPGDPQALTLRAAWYRATGRYGAALQDAARVLANSNPPARAHHERALIRARFGDRRGALEDMAACAQLGLTQGSAPLAEQASELVELLHRADREHPLTVPAGLSLEAYLELGDRWLILGGMLGFARLAYERALAVAPQNARAWAGLGLLGAMGGDPEGKSLIEQARELDPEAIWPRVREAEAVSGEGDHAGALARLDAVLTQAPQHAGALRARAGSHHRLGNSQAALRDVELAYQTGDQPTLALFLQADLLERSGQLAGALAAIRLAVEQDPQETTFQLPLASLLARSGELDAARHARQRAIELAHDAFPRPYLKAAWRWAELADWVALERTAQAALDRGRIGWQTHYLLGLAKVAQGEMQAGLPLLVRARQLNPLSVPLRMTLSRAQRGSGAPDQALLEAEAGLRLDPGSYEVELQFERAFALVDLGRREEARAVYDLVAPEARGEAFLEELLSALGDALEGS